MAEITYTNNMNQVILVNQFDQQMGTCEKIKAHEEALLHRAFSVFIYHDHFMCIQKRAAHKYHCPSLWTNTCCSHPMPKETTLDAANRRLFEECGIHADIEEIFHFTYFAQFSNGLCEYEVDHVFIGKSNEKIISDPEEIEETKWIDFDELLEDVQKNPKKYTPWFIIALPKVIERITNG